jgi:uncharacterized damage-inducible protein DinB
METTLQILLAHNVWATQKLIDACKALTAEQFHQRFEIGMGSLHDTILHIVGAMMRWSDRVAGRTLRPSPEKSGQRYSPAQLQEMLAEADRELRAVADEVAAQHALRSPMSLTFEGTDYRFSKAAALVHVTTHGMHHRAQALNMLRRLGMTSLVDAIDALDWAIVEQTPIRPAVQDLGRG